jgi:hypothetical protein
VWSADIFARSPGSTSVQLTGVSVAVLRLTRRRARKFLAYRPLGHWPETALWEPSDHSRRIVAHSETVRLGACRPFVELPACLKLLRNGHLGSVGMPPLSEPCWV